MLAPVLPQRICLTEIVKQFSVSVCILQIFSKRHKSMHQHTDLSLLLLGLLQGTQHKTSVHKKVIQNCHWVYTQTRASALPDRHFTCFSCWGKCRLKGLTKKEKRCKEATTKGIFIITKMLQCLVGAYEHTQTHMSTHPIGEQRYWGSFLCLVRFRASQFTHLMMVEAADNLR